LMAACSSEAGAVPAIATEAPYARHHATLARIAAAARLLCQAVSTAAAGAYLLRPER
jgi:hypothetical protein